MANKKIQDIYSSFTKEKNIVEALTQETKKKLKEVEDSLGYKDKGKQLQTDSKKFLKNLQEIFKNFYDEIQKTEESYFQDKRVYMVWDYVNKTIGKKHKEIFEKATQNQKANLQKIGKGIKEGNERTRTRAKRIKEAGKTPMKGIGKKIFSILSNQYQKRTVLHNRMVEALKVKKEEIDVLDLIKNHGVAIGAASRAHESGHQDLFNKGEFFKYCLQYQGKLNEMMNQSQVTVFVSLDIKERVIQIFQIPESEIPGYVSIGTGSDERQLIFKYSVGQIKRAAKANNNLISISQSLITVKDGTTISKEIVNALSGRQVDDHLKKTINAYFNGDYKVTSEGIGAQAFIKYLLSQSQQPVGLGALIHEVDNVSGLLQGDMDLGSTQLAIKSANASSLSIPQLIETAKVIISIKSPENVIPFLFFLKDALNVSPTLINKGEYKAGNEAVDEAIRKEIERIAQTVTNLTS